MATFLPFDGLRSNNCQLFFMAISVEYRCNLAMLMGVSSMLLYTQAPSHNFSTGQTLLHPAPIMFD